MKEKILVCIWIMIFSYTKSFSQIYTSGIDSLTNTPILIKDVNYLIGKEICDFEAISLNNHIISTYNLIGRVTIINFWFEGCV